MKKYFYPAIFTEEEEGGYSVEFPDLKGCFTEGETMSEAYTMSQEAMGLYLEDLICDKKDLPAASNVSTIDCKEGQCVVMVLLDMDEYYKKYDNKAVKKTLTIPAWLNQAAEKYGVNYSQILQDALKEKLHL